MFALSLPRWFVLSGLALLFLGLGHRALPADPDMEELLKGLESPIKAKRLQAMKGLGMKGTAAKEAIAPLIDHMRRHKDQELANQAAQALAQIGPPAVGELIKALEDPSAAVQIRALSALGVLGPEARQGIVPISRFLENKDAKIRRLAAWVLGEIGPPARPAADTLAKALRDADSDVRRLAAESLHEIGPEMVTHLLPALKDEDLSIRLSTVQALAIFHERKEAVQALVDALRDPKIKVRTAAATALVRLGPEGKAALPNLLDSLKESDLEVQTKAFTAIVAIGSHADSLLLNKLSSINQSQRWTGPYILKQYGPRPSDGVKPLLRLLKDADATNRLGATLALAKLAPVSKTVVAASVKKAQTDLNLAVQAAAVVALAVSESNRPEHTEKAGKLISRVVENLKDSEEVDPDKVVQLYILASTLSSSGFPGDLADPQLKSQIQETMKWANEAVDKLPPLAVPALVRGINCAAQFQLAFTEPCSRLSLRLLALADKNEDLPSLMYAMNDLGKGVPKGSPYLESFQRIRLKILTDSMLLEKLLEESKTAVTRDTADMAKLLKVPFLMFVPGCHFGHLVISTAKESNLGKQLDKKLAKEKQLIRVLELYRKHKMFFKTDELARSLWNKPIPFVVEKLNDPDPTVRWVAVQIINRRRIPAEKELIKLLSDPKREVRQAAHHALVRLGRTVDFGLRPQLWTAWAGIQEPSTYRPPSSEEPGSIDLDFPILEKKKISPKKGPGEKPDPKSRDIKGDDREKKSDLKNTIPKKEPGEQPGRDTQASLQSLSQALWQEAWLFEFALRTVSPGANFPAPNYDN